MAYEYEILTSAQIKLLDDYVPALNKLGFAEIIDGILATLSDGEFDSLTTTGDITCGRDLTVTRNIVGLTAQIGGGYGTTGLTIDTDGNVDSDGYGQFTGGIITGTATPASGDAGVPGTVVWGSNYLYVCFASGDWRRLTPTAAY